MANIRRVRSNCDLSPRALALNVGGRNVVGSAMALPFPDNAFDVVVASQMTHHLESDADVARHFAEAYRVARKAVVRAVTEGRNL